MNTNHDLGKYGENLAIKWLGKNGFTIINKNWKYGRYEIDVITEKENILHAIEIKTRRTSTFGYPEQSISPSKQKISSRPRQRIWQDQHMMKFKLISWP